MQTGEGYLSESVGSDFDLNEIYVQKDDKWKKCSDNSRNNIHSDSNYYCGFSMDH